MFITSPDGTISIHTPARGVTKTRFICTTYPNHFNPHSRTGSDLNSMYISESVVLISIHTPARGVTCSAGRTHFQASYFNPHSRTGSDYFDAVFKSANMLFQSTLPHGE